MDDDDDDVKEEEEAPVAAGQEKGADYCPWLRLLREEEIGSTG